MGGGRRHLKTTFQMYRITITITLEFLSNALLSTTVVAKVVTLQLQLHST